MGGEYGDSLLYPHSLKCLAKAFLFLQGRKKQPGIYFFKDIKFKTLTSIEEDGMIYHNLCKFGIGYLRRIV